MQRRETYILKLFSADDIESVRFRLQSATSDEQVLFDSLEALVDFLKHRPLREPPNKDTPKP
jgi:hypothetical protein